MKRAFVWEYFEGKSLRGLKKAITPDWSETNLQRHLQLMEVPAGAQRVLEIGCGIGRLLMPLYDQGASYCLGVDASRDMVNTGRHLVENRKIQFLHCDGSGEIKFPRDNYFDFAFSIITFQHIPSPAAVQRYLAEAFRLLKPGALLRFQVLAEDLHPDRELWTFHDPMALIAYLETLGFVEIGGREDGVWAIIQARKPAALPGRIQVSVSIMAHEKRKQFIPYIHEKLGVECPVAWDRYNNRWDTGRRAWELHDPEATHHLVLQDDVILSENLLAAVHKVAAAQPVGPVSLFARNKTRWNRLIQQCALNRREVRWLVLQSLNWGPAVLLPVSDIKPMIDWVENNCHMPNYDVRIGYYYLTRGVHCYYTMPSLVDHRTEGNSLIWHMRTQANRFARFFIGENKSGANLDWRGKEIREPVPLSEYFDRIRKINEEHRRKEGAVNE